MPSGLTVKPLAGTSTSQKAVLIILSAYSWMSSSKTPTLPDFSFLLMQTLGGSHEAKAEGAVFPATHEGDLA